MTWKLPETKHKKFKRNTLIAVVVQLRFHPILKIADGIADFQDRVRERFPVFLEGASELVSFKPPDLVNVRKEQQFSFAKEDGSCSILLGLAALALENRQHTGHNQLLNDTRLAMESLIATCHPVIPHRLGMRYINIIDKDRIARDLDRDISWNDLISEEFLRMPADLTDLDSTLFANEISSKVNGGTLTLRYGLLPGKQEGQTHFRFDTDRYVEGSFDPAGVMEKLFTFVHDLYAPFAKMMGPALEEWMSPIVFPPEES